MINKKILFRYISLSFLRSFFIVVVCFFLITALLESMEIIRRFAASHISISYISIIQLTILRSFNTISSFFPFTAFLGAILFFITMHNRFELTIIKGVGVSIIEILRYLILVILSISLFYITVFDVFSTFCVNKVKSIEFNLKQTSDLNENIKITNAGVWFKDISQKKSYIIYTKTFHNEFLYNVRFYEFDKTNDFVESIYADSAIIKDHNWILNNVKLIDSNGIENTKNKYIIPTTLSFNSIKKMTTNPNSISFWSISKYINMLDKVGLSSIKYKIHWYLKLSSIIQMIALVMFASVFCSNYDSRNTKRYALKVSVVLSMAFPIHFANNVLIAFAEKGSIPIFLSAFFIPVFMITIIYYLLMKK